MRSEQYSVYEIQNDRVHRYSRIERVKGKSNHAVLTRMTERKHCFLFYYYSYNKSQIQE